MQFLGSCEVCGQTVRNYRALSQHFRFNPDEKHRALQEKWQDWRSQYQATLRCMKCGDTWTITDKKLKGSKRCPRCESLRQQLGKRAYEKLPTLAVPAEPLNHKRRSARWDGLQDRSVKWERGDDLYREVVAAWEFGDTVRVIMRRSGVSYKTYLAIVLDAYGEEKYKQMAHERIVARGRRNIAKSHARYAQLSPEEKAQRLKKLFGRGSKLEHRFVEQLQTLSEIHEVETNDWMSFLIEGKWVPREADIKFTYAGKKIVVLCDGEKYHGPGCLFGDPASRIAIDVATTHAFHARGYSVVRYSETELRSGAALEHLRGVVRRFAKDPTALQVYRTWHPLEEKWTRIP